MTLQTEYGTGITGYSTDLALTMWDGAHGTRKPIIALHGDSLSAVTWGPIVAAGVGTTTAFDHVRALVAAGYAVCAIDAGGYSNWAGPACQTAIGNAYTYMTGRFGHTKVGLLAFSMGGIGALNWEKRNTAKTAGVFAFSPATDLSYFYQPSGYTPAYSTTGAVLSAAWPGQINTAYSCTSSTYASATAGYRVYDEYATYVDGVPKTLTHADNDTTVPVGQSQEFCTATGATLIETALGGHGNFAQVSPSALVRFFDPISFA